MNKDWQQFLQQQTIRQGWPDAGRGMVCDLSSKSLIVVAGEDAADFMQGQFTNDVKQVDDSHSQLAALCNNKGRMLANFRLFKNQGNYFLALHASLSDSVVSHLQQYILRANVGVQDISEQLVHLGLAGEAAGELIAGLSLTPPQEVDQVAASADAIVIRIAGNMPRYEVYAAPEQAQALWQQAVEAGLDTLADEAWEYLDILAGLPFIDASNSAAFVPQMANMDLINGISFTKGCYTGQEIVARMHYLGKLKKRCFRVHIDSETRPQSGDQLFAENARAGQNTGALISLAASPEGGFAALAVIQLADSDKQLHLHDAEGPRVTVGELPYALELEEEG